MNGQEIISHIVKAKMPDKEQVRENCHRHAFKDAGKKRSPWVKRIVPTCACAVVAIIAVLAFVRNGLFNTTTPTAANDKPPFQAVEHTPSAPGDNGQNTPGVLTPAETKEGIYIPAIELPENANGTAADMIGFFVYQGHIYTQAAWYRGGDAEFIKKTLVGEKIGYAKGNIDEWSTHDDYAFELAGSVCGDVYTVKGYDESFRLCMIGTFTYDDGHEDEEWISFYERLNDIRLAFGLDLFGDRLGIRDNRNSVRYKLHDDWNYGRDIFNSLIGIADDDIAAFVDMLYQGRFEYVYETVGDTFYYSEREQAHLYIYMDDNTVVELRLFEDGYVGYQHLGWYFVKIPGEAFDTIFEACIQ